MHMIIYVWVSCESSTALRTSSRACEVYLVSGGFQNMIKPIALLG